jgi:hypothetical protein
MATYPSDIIPTGFDETRNRPMHSSESEAGYVSQRPKGTKKFMQFDISYNNLTDAQKTTLEDFYDANIGQIVTYIHPTTGTSYDVRYDADKITFKRKPKMNSWSHSVSLKEI